MSKTTNIIHSIPVDPLTGSISVPIYQTATFVQEAPGVNKGYDYARSNNPTRAVLENLVATLEGGSAAFAFATGLAAIDAVLKTLSYGDEIVAVEDIYGGAYRLFTQVYQKFGIKIHYVDTTDANRILDVINEKTKLVWIESPTNPTLKITDIAQAAKIAHAFNALLVVDNTFASPIAQQPFVLGADIVIHSGTKYLGGHSDLVAGLVVVNSEKLAVDIKFIQNASGGILGPQDCWLLIRGIETLELRVERQCQTAFKVAQFLTQCEEVDQVYYPGLASHKNHAIAKLQQHGLYGGVLSFTLKDDTEAAATQFVTATNYFKLAESLGGVKSLCCHPAQMTHKSIPREKRLASGIQDSLIRLSCGIEGTDDLINDLKQAFTKCATATLQTI
ncbi:MAG: PLP-dependent transferase [Bacteroidetes bacterium]|jgi:cystathionine beta-lyase/cystathionine gamma-synthase|nr:PLP-dependent transferase [Bacteroidota bacterium]MBK8330760.1 PLP-dependent transferase [Bacteroidota bacterium]